MQSNSCASSPSTPMRFTAVPDGAGGVRHELRAITAEPAGKGKGKRKRKAPDPITNASAESAAQQLRQFIERAEGIIEEILGAQEELSDVFAEAKSTGFDGKTMRAIIARRKRDSDALREEDMLLEAYKAALGLN
ncbi:MAG: hypothetical protein JWM75_1257 [Sphingomonas bacterium]|nr:hypothetical protein [Sphingomonas bacterium]